MLDAGISARFNAKRDKAVFFTSVNYALTLELLAIVIWEALLGAFAKLRMASISFVMSFCLSVCPHATTRLPLDGF